MPHSDEARHRLGYHPVASIAQQHVYEENRKRFMDLFDYAQEAQPHIPSREKSLALTHLQESLMWLNAHVACNWPDGDE